MIRMALKAYNEFWAEHPLGLVIAIILILLGGFVLHQLAGK